jgi:phage terminase Nu1 subunit (DNA packaging protein)
MANQKDIAEHLDLTDRRVRGLMKEGVLPASKGPGGYDLDSCRVAYIRYLRGVSSGQVRSVGDDNEARDQGRFDYAAELEKEKWREKKRQNDLEEKLIAPVSTLTSALEKVADQVVPILESIPLEMKRLNPKLSGHDVQTVKKAIARARNAIAGVNIEIEGDDRPE